MYADTEESYVTHVQADDATGARQKAYRQAESVILIAGVVAGKINTEEDKPTDVTPLRGRGHAIVARRITVVERKIVIPSRCPKCKTDLRKPHAVLQGDLVIRKWSGHLTQRGDELSAEKNQDMHVMGRSIIDAVKLRCVMCSHDLWNGVPKGGA